MKVPSVHCEARVRTVSVDVMNLLKKQTWWTIHVLEKRHVF